VSLPQGPIDHFVDDAQYLSARIGPVEAEPNGCDDTLIKIPGQTSKIVGMQLYGTRIPDFRLDEDLAGMPWSRGKYTRNVPIHVVIDRDVAINQDPSFGAPQE
jgi:hypothetical protein